MNQALPDAGCIAIVDDEPVVRTLMRLWLEADGYSVIELPSGDEAINHDVARSAAVCLDLRLDDMPGLDVLNALRERDPNLPVIVVSGDQDTETVEEAMRAGAYDYVLKPFDRDRLRYAVRRAFERRALVASLHKMRAELGERGGSGLVAEMSSSVTHVSRMNGEDGENHTNGENGENGENGASHVGAGFDEAALNLRDLERQAIARALEVSGGSVGKAAKLLGIGRATLYRRLSEQRETSPKSDDVSRTSNGTSSPGAHGIG